MTVTLCRKMLVGKDMTDHIPRDDGLESALDRKARRVVRPGEKVCSV
jgi:hypothetical protein